jgi:hypothetical protein
LLLCFSSGIFHPKLVTFFDKVKRVVVIYDWGLELLHFGLDHPQCSSSLHRWISCLHCICSGFFNLLFCVLIFSIQIFWSVICLGEPSWVWFLVGTIFCQTLHTSCGWTLDYRGLFPENQRVNTKKKKLISNLCMILYLSSIWGEESGIAFSKSLFSLVSL